MSKFQDKAKEIADLVEAKSISYGDSFGQSGKILAILYPNGVSIDHYDDFLAITRIVDKLFRIANHKDAFQESPWSDICGYGLNAASRLHPAQKEYVIGVSTIGYHGYIHGYQGNGNFNYPNNKLTATRFKDMTEAGRVVAECTAANGSHYTYHIEEA